MKTHIAHLTILACFLQLMQCATTTLSDDDNVFTRYDRDAYLAARGGSRGNGGGEEDSALEHVDSIRDQIRRRIKSNDDDIVKDQNSYDDPIKCTTYLAPSSIPNSGLGMYTSTPYEKGEAFIMPEIGVMLQEKAYHSPATQHSLFAQYPWAATSLTFGAQEVGYGECIVPGLGMLANSHLGLVNMRHSELWKIQPWRDGTDALFRPDSLTKDDVGRGANSWHGNVVFDASAPIQAGEEFFVSYGDKWFVSREELLGIIPGDEQFKEADELLKAFSVKDGEQVVGDEQRDDNYYADRAAKYEELLHNALGKDKRLRAALPNHIEDIPAALETGTARFSVKESIRSLEWLDENGACISNVHRGKSTIPQAGNGAFATRSMKEGERITTTPVVTLGREELFLLGDMEKLEDGSGAKELVGHQLLLNYCYGHTNSSLLFFPYSPSVNFINHGSLEDSNAEIRWSTLPYHKAEWLNLTLDEMKAKLKTGLLFDIIATRDIRRGEEILLHYGKQWEESWDEHIQLWASMQDVDANGQVYLNLTERLGLPTVFEFNEVELNPVVRTKDEQSDNPYPTHIMTRCIFEPPENCVAPSQSTDFQCQSRWTLTYEVLNQYPCTILSREHIGGTDWYSAMIEVPSEETDDITRHLVEYLPRYAIRFVDRPYSRDQYSRGVFRHAIGLPDGIVPPQWLDLDGDEYVVRYEDMSDEGEGADESGGEEIM